MRTEPLMNFSYRQGENGMMYPNFRFQRTHRRTGCRWAGTGNFGKRVYDGEAPTPPVGTGGAGQSQRVILKVDEEAEQRKERLIQQFLLKQPMPDTEDTMESRPYEQPDKAGGGDCPGRTGDEGQVRQSNKGTHSAARRWYEEPSVGGFLSRLKRQKFQERQYQPRFQPHRLQKENSGTVTATTPEQTTPAAEQDLATQYRLLSRLRSDCEYFLEQGKEAKRICGQGSVTAQISKMQGVIRCCA